jgi:GAF domain-containing protein
VVDVDMLQHRTGEGPCLDAIADGTIVYADDLSDDPRWALYGPLAAELGIRSVLAVPLTAAYSVGALNLYARYPRAFGVIDRARGILLAALAGVAVTSAQTHEAEDLRSDNLREALGTREMIGQAQGILMERERVTGEEAFDILRRASQHLNIRLREVAQSLVDTGQQPETGP